MEDWSSGLNFSNKTVPHASTRCSQAFFVLQDMSWRCLQHVVSITIFLLPLANTFWRHLEDVLKTSRTTSWRRLRKRNIVTLKTSWKRLEDVLKTSWRQTKCLRGISVSNHGWLTNLNQYLPNPCLTNLYFTNLRWIQNALIRTQ